MAAEITDPGRPEAARRSLADSLRWMAEGSRTFFGALAVLPDDELDRPTALTGWTGRHLVAHVAANADALVNLAHWARTGEERPMYTSFEQRDADIRAGAVRSPAELRSWAASSAEQLDRRLSELDERQWAHPVRTAQGRTVPASEIAWLRAREVMVHAVDLGAGVGFGDLPADFLTCLIDDIAAKRSGAGDGPALVLTAAGSGGTWRVAGAGDPADVTGTLAELAAYLSGRAAGPGGRPAPALPRWL
ncbi:maleylpyruvate isomerase family mycothiol-dependent enzyme [Nonomuraea gerenzanensis]|uniref:Maleylpyruvate isomerase, mycothiol-dependent n=1 Tax=Nonomuraea gerenzanensis TaxID=93944 RepID=A0A1M4EI87_9ACTN|nr:maleylpyruvate isomerase family mycothiol-dependent enzyme [Nonomuraea gerenzanensis]UBU10231.1 maleylpyruvate isomerase family mycothiol-dependent enzyme [Nonomuraea gerenzanensis]SBO98609.1 Maleylpyruvate isomerase, mycothiol-dependent [Nonomuraea gerenzanensis]